MSQDNTPRKGRFFWSSLCCGLAALAFLIGILAPNHYLPWLSFHNEVPVFLAVVFLWLGAALSRTSIAPIGMPVAIWAAFVLLICLQWFFGKIYFFGDAFVSILYVCGAAAAWWLGAHQVKRLSPTEHETVLAQVATVFVIAAAASGFVALIQWLGLEYRLGIFAVERAPSARPSSNLAQPNLLATLVVMGTMFSLYLTTRRHLKPWQGCVLLTFLAFALIATESRQGLLGAVCVSAFLLWYRRSCVTLDWKYLAWWWASLLLFWGIWGPLNEALLLQAPRTMELQVDSVRLVLWKQALTAISQAPWTGYGWRQTAVAQKVGVEAVPSDVTTDYAHNVILDLLCWVGIPLGIAFTAFGVWWILRTIRRIANGRQVWLMGVTIPIFVHSMLEFPFAYAFFLFPLAAFLGALHALQSPTSFRICTGPRWIAFTSLSAFALACGGVVVEYMQAEEDMRVMRFELRNVGSKPIDYAAPQLTLLTQLDEMLKLGRVQPRRGMSPSELQRWGDANRALSWATLHLKYVVALALNDREDEANRELRVLKNLYGPMTYRQAQGQIQHWRATQYPDLPMSLGE